ncbi:helix-turn-helix domain-containing protein [Rhodococcus sp. NPDC003318]|uniref:helix-turn-helix domain-containing protein n=1 Tax=Rhodococcus sp. NPDC003318 TaxID=3364503 RepID=UPI003684AC37
MRETLRVFLRTGGSFARTSEALVLHRNTVRVEPVTGARRELRAGHGVARQYPVHESRRGAGGLLDHGPPLLLVRFQHDPGDPVDVAVHPAGEVMEQLQLQRGPAVQLLDLLEDVGRQVVGADVVCPPQRRGGHTGPGESDRVLGCRSSRLDVLERDVVAQHVQDGGDVALHAGAQHVRQFGVVEVDDRGVHAVVDLGESLLETVPAIAARASTSSASGESGGTRRRPGTPFTDRLAESTGCPAW